MYLTVRPPAVAHGVHLSVCELALHGCFIDKQPKRQEIVVGFMNMPSSNHRRLYILHLTRKASNMYGATTGLLLALCTPHRYFDFADCSIVLVMNATILLPRF